MVLVIGYINFDIARKIEFQFPESTTSLVHPKRKLTVILVHDRRYWDNHRSIGVCSGSTVYNQQIVRSNVWYIVLCVICDSCIYFIARRQFSI